MAVLLHLSPLTSHKSVMVLFTKQVQTPVYSDPMHKIKDCTEKMFGNIILLWYLEVHSTADALMRVILVHMEILSNNHHFSVVLHIRVTYWYLLQH